MRVGAARRDNVFAELEVDLGQVQAGILDIARSPVDFLDGKLSTAAAAALRFREAVSAPAAPTCAVAVNRTRFRQSLADEVLRCVLSKSVCTNHSRELRLM